MPAGWPVWAMRTCRARPRVVAISPDLTSGRWARLFAALYDPVLALGELTGLRRQRRALLAAAHGRVVELGAGTGLNLRHYPDGVDELLLVEPDPAMRRQLARRLRRMRRAAEIVDAPAERLPFSDHSVDTVVATLVLCTVDDPRLALREITRVLRPGGKLLFLEHVRAPTPRLARWQQRLHEPWRHFACGCRCDRATVELIRACGFEFDELAGAVWRAMPPIVRPLAIGHARPA
ncbi:class I SAM-dependent methyltransferase [Solirubrobacter ginsenosidimutans]|uniref:Class I SAM-dependent methyltransferase n=1 Tax=Solirubrobacter ginsenosidimutans TaxID=490573 RepID=A0A9X3MQT1_9ACTN|nr:class I SAM-dependent methyltransferase [Solirubrobacter ginsenosidimutans]MDA0160809.1 class I SAM-dependent methyltransferase [Solirubrobacter ginsenosidimutans]